MKKPKNKKDVCPMTMSGKHMFTHFDNQGEIVVMLEDEEVWEEVHRCIACGLIDDRR